jgi:hypothetical protein
MGVFLAAKRLQWSRATHMSTVHVSLPSVITSLIDEVPELKNFETLGGSIEKINTLGVELKISTNFRRVNSNFSKIIIMSHENV